MIGGHLLIVSKKVGCDCKFLSCVYNKATHTKMGKGTKSESTWWTSCDGCDDTSKTSKKHPSKCQKITVCDSSDRSSKSCKKLPPGCVKVSIYTSSDSTSCSHETKKCGCGDKCCCPAPKPTCCPPLLNPCCCYDPALGGSGVYSYQGRWQSFYGGAYTRNRGINGCCGAPLRCPPRKCGCKDEKSCSKKHHSKKSTSCSCSGTSSLHCSKVGNTGTSSSLHCSKDTWTSKK